MKNIYCKIFGHDIYFSQGVSGWGNDYYETKGCNHCSLGEWDAHYYEENPPKIDILRKKLEKVYLFFTFKKYIPKRFKKKSIIDDAFDDLPF